MGQALEFDMIIFRVHWARAGQYYIVFMFIFEKNVLIRGMYTLSPFAIYCCRYVDKKIKKWIQKFLPEHKIAFDVLTLMS